LLSRRNGLHNSRRHRRLQGHQLSPALQRNNRRVLQDNQARRCNPVLKSRVPQVNHLRACRQAHRECPPLVQSALLL
jgi:hypothetical protein